MSNLLDETIKALSIDAQIKAASELSTLSRIEDKSVVAPSLDRGGRPTRLVRFGVVYETRALELYSAWLNYPENIADKENSVSYFGTAFLCWEAISSLDSTLIS